MIATSSIDRERALAAALIETLQMPAIIIDADGTIMAANKIARGQLGSLKMGQALTLSLRAPEILDSVARVKAGAPAEVVTWRPRVPVERVFDVSVAAIGMAGYEKYVVITLQDLTETHRVERMRVDFVANVSHELRTPLASVLGFIETLQGPARDDAAARDRFLEIMRDQGRRMARLIDDLLSLSRIEQNEHLRPSAPVDLVDVVRHVLDALRPMGETAKTTFEVDVPERLVVKNSSFYVRRGEIVGFAGLMGAGRTELAMSVFGHSYGNWISGEIYKDGNRIEVRNVSEAIDNGMAYVSEDRKVLGLNLLDDIKQSVVAAKLSKIAKRGVVDDLQEYAVADEYRKRLRIRTPDVNRGVSTLSGGNQQKVVLAKWMFTDPDILILDEPTRGIDVGAKFEIYGIIQELAAQGKGVIVISSELPELLGISDRIYTIFEGQITADFPIAEATPETLLKSMTSAKKRVTR